MTFAEILAKYGKNEKLREAIQVAWIAAEDRLKARIRLPSPPLEGCGDHSCIVAPTRGMGTNGGCRCDIRALRVAVQVLHAEVDRLKLDKVEAEK